ncbi:TIGR01777 family oxidoreductase [Bacillus sp. ISL-47]|uniref:TIGR01777 family oxidoreductase n=1 Tax=Bacillus sp. ISL-47 TaxID=2819130 RepID=UPI001BE64BE1|nr:TIGR01777 family oxidoreductase [Bacillus sp. ISL-47]MBT2688905.1 TIGR01777 family oxidoreductase [Bacillus sp. ISL-47]MBT2708816.1 TIGR01777 family oxidoreductase [Pseudomonas sp. ISL-84]
MSKRIVLAGGSGFLGQALADHVKKRGYTAVILTRGSSAEKNGITYVHWDGRTLEDSWVREIEGSYAIVNFTGKSVNCLYTKKNREEILASRLDSVRILKEAVRESSAPPQVFVQAGSLAVFGDTTDVCDEDAAHGDGFSVSVCQQWEEAFFNDTLPKTRQVMLRIGFALGKDGGALGPLQMLARYGLGGTIGSGRQYISWLHMDDLNAMFMASIENENYEGIYNATGTAPVTNKEFMRVLRKVMNKSWAPPAPAPLVKLGAYTIMRADPSLALTGRNCIPKKLLEHGFNFKFTNLEAALRDII